MCDVNTTVYIVVALAFLLPLDTFCRTLDTVHASIIIIVVSVLVIDFVGYRILWNFFAFMHNRLSDPNVPIIPTCWEDVVDFWRDFKRAMLPRKKEVKEVKEEPKAPKDPKKKLSEAEARRERINNYARLTRPKKSPKPDSSNELERKLAERRAWEDNPQTEEPPRKTPTMEALDQTRIELERKLAERVEREKQREWERRRERDRQEEMERQQEECQRLMNEMAEKADQEKFRRNKAEEMQANKERQAEERRVKREKRESDRLMAELDGLEQGVDVGRDDSPEEGESFEEVKQEDCD